MLNALCVYISVTRFIVHTYLMNHGRSYAIQLHELAQNSNLTS